MMLRLAATTAALSALAVMAGGQARADASLSVYIECRNPKQADLPVFKGTGVLVSPMGHVLTAEHVMPKGYECVGAVENNTLSPRRLLVDFKDSQIPDQIDAKLLRFIKSSGEVFPHATYCVADADDVGEFIIAVGFHGKSLGLPSITRGVLSTYIPNARGIIESDADTVGGKSGGPVFLFDTKSIIGIVAGAEFDPSGLPAYYGVLTVEALNHLGILAKSEDCGGTQAQPQPVVAQSDPSPPKPTDQQKPTITASVAQPKAAPMPMPDGFDADVNKLVQGSLNALGYDTKGVDGVWGRATGQAMSDWRVAQGNDPKNPLELLELIALLESAAAVDSGIEVIITHPEFSSEIAEALYDEAYYNYDNKNYDLALIQLDKALEITPGNAKYLIEQGFNYNKLGRHQDAINVLTAALSIEPDHANAFSERGWAYWDSGQAQKALSDFDKALAIKPDHEDANLGRSRACEKLGTC